MRRKQTQYIKRVLYTLKRGYGFPLTLLKIDEETYDKETGKRTAIIEHLKIKKAIVLPSDFTRKFDYDLAFIAANRNFTYGGFYDTSTRKIIIDATDLGDWDIEIEDYFIFDEKRWQIARVHEFELQTGFMIMGREVKGAPRYLVEEISLEDTLQLTQEIT